MPLPIFSTTFLVPIGTAAQCRRREPPVFKRRAQAASGMCAIAHSLIEPQLGKVLWRLRLDLVWWCGQLRV